MIGHVSKCCILTFMFVYCLQLTIRSVRDQLGKGIYLFSK